MTTSIGTSGATFPDSTVQTSAWVGYRGQLFTSSGTFTIPAGVTAAKFTYIGAGGGGAGSYTPSPHNGGAGGASLTGVKYLTGLASGLTLTVTIGAAGTAGAVNANGGAGGTSSVSSGTQSITTFSSTGGGGGICNPQTPGSTGTLSNQTFTGSYYVQGYGVQGSGGLYTFCCCAPPVFSAGTAGTQGYILIEW